MDRACLTSAAASYRLNSHSPTTAWRRANWLRRQSHYLAVPAPSLGQSLKPRICSHPTAPNFRIDGCQYIYNLYNLATSSLGTGTYAVSISIGGSVVGS